MSHVDFTTDGIKTKCQYKLYVFDSNNRDVDETISWIKEKEQLMASDDFGRDLASVQALLRKHEGLERDLAALEDKAGRCFMLTC